MDGIERLHYYNGRRLAAADFCVEQHYHIAMRRLLNQGLFTPGVVNGLEVKKADATHVLVAPGLALDPAGREIVVPDGPDEDRTIAVPAQPATKKLGGYFLVVRYREEQIPASEDPCAAPATPQAARIRESAELTWTEDYPAPSLCDPKRPSIDCAVVLALVTTTAACEISAIEVDIRQDSRPKNVSQISAFALEGEKDIDKDNPKILHFQISGGAPDSVVLYLWGGKFSPAFYTELGKHDHELSGIAVADANSPLASHSHGLTHTHSLLAYSGITETKPDQTTKRHPAEHNHQVKSLRGDVAALIQRHRGPNDPFDYQWGDEAAPLIWWNGVHEHEFTIPAARTQDPTPTQSGDALVQGLPPHRHTFPAATATKFTGVPEIAARSGTDASGKQVAAKTCFSSLRVELDGADLTGAILARTSWQRIGDGTDGHPLVTSQFGTGALDLLEMAHAAGRALGAGLHTLVFRLDDDNDSGGKVLYNLYVE